MPHTDREEALAYFRQYSRARRAEKSALAGPEPTESASTTRTYSLPTKGPSGESGEVLFVAAFLRLMVADARRRLPQRSAGDVVLSDPESAREFLRDTERVAYWAELVGADVGVVQDKLLRQAGMTTGDKRGTAQ